MQNIRERLTWLLPAIGASSRRTARFAVTSLTAGVDMGKRIFKKNHGFSARCPAFFFQKLNMSDVSILRDFYVPSIKDQGHLVFVPLCVSMCACNIL